MHCNKGAGKARTIAEEVPGAETAAEGLLLVLYKWRTFLCRKDTTPKKYIYTTEP